MYSVPIWLHASELLNCPSTMHVAHSDGGFAPPRHAACSIATQAVLLERVPGMHAAHMGLTEVGARLRGHAVAFGAQLWYPGSAGEPQQTPDVKSQL